MKSTLFSDGPISALFHNLKDQIRTLIHEEVQLATAEMTEKGKRVGKRLAIAAGAGAVAATGLWLLLLAFGFLASWGFSQLGWGQLVSLCTGFGSLGLIIAFVGGIAALAAIKSLSSEHLTPEKTLETLKELQQSVAGPTPFPRSQAFSSEESASSKAKKSSDEIEPEVRATETDLAISLAELRQRFSPEHLKQRTDEEVYAHPYRWGLLAMGTGIMSGALLKRRFTPAPK